jgi:hypothetical protein
MKLVKKLPNRKFSENPLSGSFFLILFCEDSVLKPEGAFLFLPFDAGVEIRYPRVESLVHGHKTLKLRM